MFEHIARGLLRPINPYLSVLVGVLTLLWGLWLVSPFWETMSRASVYSKALEFVPEWAWGSWATLCGLTIIISLIFNSPKLLVKALGFATWHWFTVAGMLWWGDWQNTAGLTYTFVGLYCVSTYLNIKTNYVKMGVTEL